MRFSRLIIGLTTLASFAASAANVENYVSQLPDGANLALIVQKVGASSPVIEYHSKQMALPASTQKVITALAALLQLGPEYRFTTTLESHGAIKGGILNGDLIARFSGDPTFRRQSLHDMVAKLRQAGIQKINGNVLIDTSVFASHDKAPGWPWNDITQCFSAPPSAAIVEKIVFPSHFTAPPKLTIRLMYALLLTIRLTYLARSEPLREDHLMRSIASLMWLRVI